MFHRFLGGFLSFRARVSVNFRRMKRSQIEKVSQHAYLEGSPWRLEYATMPRSLRCEVSWRLLPHPGAREVDFDGADGPGVPRQSRREAIFGHDDDRRWFLPAADWRQHDPLD